MRRLALLIPRDMAPSQCTVRVLGAAVLLGALAYVGVMPLFFVAIVGCTLAAAWWPDSHAGLATWALVLVAWFFGARDPSSVNTVLLAQALIVHHACLVLAATGPYRAPIPRSLLVITCLRCLVVSLPTVAMWFLLRAVNAAGPIQPPAVITLAACTALVMAAWYVSRSRQ